MDFAQQVRVVRPLMPRRRVGPWWRAPAGKLSYPRCMTENEIKLKAIAALTALRGGVGTDYASDLLGEVIPEYFMVPADADANEIGRAVLGQLSKPLSALITGFVLAFEAVTDVYEETGPEVSTEQILQALALQLAAEPEGPDGLDGLEGLD
jgi:hypothetical protein